MGCSGSTPTWPQVNKVDSDCICDWLSDRRSRIEEKVRDTWSRVVESKERRSIRLSQRLEPKSFNIVLLGTGDSGKSTICKQLQSQYDVRYADPVFRESFANVVIGNVLDGTLQVLNRMSNKDEEPYRSAMERLRQETRSGPRFLSPQCARIISDLYFTDAKFQGTMRGKADAVQLHDCYHYFCSMLEQYPHWGGKIWTPSVDDCVRARARTYGVNNVEIDVDPTTRLVITDVGGQRAERRKWIQSPELIADASMLVYVVALSEYNQALFEDRRKNRLEEALDLFAECFKSPWLTKKDLSIALFFNKLDLFKHKFLEEKIPINVSGRFPDAPKQNGDFKAVIDWLANKFASKVPQRMKNSVTIHVITATDPACIKTVFTQCTDLIMQKYLNSKCESEPTQRVRKHEVPSSKHSVVSSVCTSTDSYD